MRYGLYIRDHAQEFYKVFMLYVQGSGFITSAMALWLSHQMVVGRLGFEPRSPR
ncbi:hypothetical protein BS47DRAFT_1056144 [Hydnum rufescens UP504]|uniref:Uncharacterized protein n=1 Tax=Hydnum rufescens UP504 TaxID=1448309 RepID=A0A9P6AVR3_9AGAM|nr:hypothetical protein BS47DRAFT_1056144 [Hydnum rufescens UP504]